MTKDTFFILFLSPKTPLYLRLSCCNMTHTHWWNFYLLSLVHMDGGVKACLSSCCLLMEQIFCLRLQWSSHQQDHGYVPSSQTGQKSLSFQFEHEKKKQTAQRTVAFIFFHLIGFNSTEFIQSEFCRWLALFSISHHIATWWLSRDNLPIIWSFLGASSKDKMW